ncbi:MAG: hypothetical protein HY735_34020 [Verrucomicrobia bacterium]|nr:hypothetical protein [Verrucomicrobiota bacterium]
MKKPVQKRRRLDYPLETPGSKLAAEARKRANSLTDDQRAEALEGARALIYGHAKTRQVAGARR